MGGSIYFWSSGRSLGYKIAVYTSRGPESYDAIREWCKEHKIEVDFINDNPFCNHFSHAENKPVFDIYIDDKNIRFENNWKDIVRNIRNFIYPWWMKDRR